MTTARVVKDVKPDYTREAARRKIEGDVEMMAIIERDGSVNLVRITQSLDPTYGLDAAAVKTLKKWRFSPATRNGVAVRLRIRVVMTFTMFAGDTMTGPVLEWPSAFHARVSPLDGAPDRWTEQTVNAGPPLVSIRYPKDWNTAPTTKTDTVFAATLDRPRYARGFVVSHSIDVGVDRTETMTDRLMQKMAEQARTQVTHNDRVELLKFGQVRSRERLWFWAELSRQLPLSGGRRDVVRIWVFTTAERRQQLSVVCLVTVPGDSYTIEEREQLNLAGADFAAMVQRIGIATR